MKLKVTCYQNALEKEVTIERLITDNDYVVDFTSETFQNVHLGTEKMFDQIYNTVIDNTTNETIIVFPTTVTIIHE